jgi:cytochrome c oxidase subunit 1
MTEPLPQSGEPPRETPVDYLNVSFGWKSWLFTTDHKRIALLYLVVITLMFFVGGAFAVLIRLELATPEADLMERDTYNKMFTAHGIVMVFFFLIPAIPSILGNFLVPMMIGAKDLAFPKLNLLRSLPSGGCSPAAWTRAGRFTRPTARARPTPTSCPLRWGP